jgi:hypothetical protein
MTYQEFRIWSPVFDCEVVRLSLANRLGREFFMLLKDNAGARVYRAKRRAALQLLTEAIEAGRDPGQIQAPRAVWERMVAEAMKELAA